MTELSWGGRYVMVPPEHFRIDYAINPFMDTSVQPDRARVREEYAAIVAAIEAAGGEVVEVEQRPDAPDMVYAMNLGFFVESDRGPGVVLSHMRYPERRMETASTSAWAVEHGYRQWRIGRDGIGAHFESGDAFAWRGDLVVGHGFRTDELAVKHLATDLGVTAHGIRITHPGMYHLDLSFCPLDDSRAIVCPEAYDSASATRLLGLIPEPLVISEAEAMTFCANSVVVGTTVIMPACPARVRAQLETWGFEVVVVEVPEYLKGGGAIRCLTNPLDVRLGRDLTLRA
ncbi:MAG TPA: arginine deiminase family protein [Marmoricola sp.]